MQIRTPLSPSWPSDLTLRSSSPRPVVVAIAAPEAEIQPYLTPLLAGRAAQGMPIGIILGHNRLDVYALARWAQARQLDPRPLLARLDVSRAFTCHQLHRRVLTLDASQTTRWAMLCVLGLLETFYDEDVKHAEALRLLRECLAHLKNLSARGLPILLTLSAPREPGREHLMSVVRAQVDLYWEPDPAAPGLEAPRQLALDIGTASLEGEDSHGPNVTDRDPTDSGI